MRYEMLYIYDFYENFLSENLSFDKILTKNLIE